MKELNFVGVGGATAIDLGGNCAYVKDAGKLFVIDACEELTLKLKNKNVFDEVSEIFIAITHTHADHVAGLGVFLWYANFVLNITPKIIVNSFKFKCRIKKMLKILGVNKKYFEFVNPSQVLVDGATVTMISTIHSENLDCFGILFEDENGKYYYSGDTTDVQLIKKFSQDETVKRIYLEIANESFGVHMKYEWINQFDKNKLILMHFEDIELYKKAQNDGYKCANVK